MKKLLLFYHTIIPYIGCVGMVFSLYIFIALSSFPFWQKVQPLPFEIHTIQSNGKSIGDGPMDQCFISLTPNLIDSGIEFFLCHMDTLFQEYIGYTRNLMRTNDALSLDYVSLLYTPVKKLAFMILPLAFLICIAIEIINGSISLHHAIGIEKYMTQFLQNVILLLILPLIYEQGIDLSNAICQYILHLTMQNNQTITVSSILTQSIHVSQITSNQFLPSIVATILWIGFFLSILYIIGFFIVRFIIIWVMFLAIPLLIATRMLHVGEGLLEGIMIKTIQFIIVQPIFLFALDFFLLIMRHEVDSIAKLLLAICCLFTLGFIPSFIAGITGGKLANISTHEVQNIAHGLIQRGSIVLGWLSEPEIYEIPLEKPDKK